MSKNKISIYTPRERRSVAHLHCGDYEEPFNVYEVEISERLSRMLLSLIRFPSKQATYYEHGYRSGELREDNLWQIAANIENARPFSVLETVHKPDLHVGLLVDCSGSMQNSTDSVLPSGFGGVITSKHYRTPDGRNHCFTLMTSARILSYALSLAFADQEGVKLTVAGHTEIGGSIEIVMCKRPNSKAEVENFRGLTAQAGNIDGPALVNFVDQMSKEVKPGEGGVVFLICDGAPCHNPDVMQRCMSICRDHYNINPFVFGVGSGLDDETCKRLYGIGNYLLVPSVTSSAMPIASRLNYELERLAPM